MNTMFGIIGSIIIGGFVGWLAGKIMKTKGSLLWNIIFGIVGGALGSICAKILHIGGNGFVWQIIIGVAGTCLLIFLCRLFIKKR